MAVYSEEYWAKRLGPDVPERVKKAIQRVYYAYTEEDMPQGVCDPMYIMNVIAKELGVGDGCGHFTLPPEKEG